MLSKNNFNERVRQMDEKKERFSIRKLTVGAASVLIGMTIFGMSNSQSVKADTQDASDDNQAESQDVKAESNQNENQQTVDQTSQELKAGDLENEVKNTDSSDATSRALLNEKLANADPETSAKLANKLNVKDPTKSEVTDSADEEVHVYFPGNNNDDAAHGNGSGIANYRMTIHHQITGVKDSKGNITWNPTEISAQDLKDILDSHNFVDQTGDNKGGHSLPKLDGYVPVITHIETMNDHQYLAQSEKLHEELDNWLDTENDNTKLPSYKIDVPVRSSFAIHYYKEIKGSAKTQIDVYMPGNNNDTTGNNGGETSYWAYIANVPMVGYVDDEGNKVWTGVDVSAQNLSDVLKGNNFVNGSKYHQTLPNLDGLIPVITNARVSYDHEYEAEGKKLFDSLNDEIKKNPNAQVLPGYSMDFPGQVIYSVHFNQEVQDTENETVYIYGPTNDRDDANSEKHDGHADYYTTIEKQTINGLKDYEGNTTWDNGVNFGSHNLADILADKNFTNNDTGYRGNALPEYKGYHAVITDAQIMGGPQEAANKLFYEVNNWIKAHPNATAIPAFASDTPLSISFNVHYVKDEEQPTQPTKPQTSTPDQKPTNPETPVKPETPAQPTTAPTTPVQPSEVEQPTEAAQPTTVPVLPEKTPDQNKSDDNDKQNETVRPHATKVAKKAAGVTKAAPVKAEATNAVKKTVAKAETKTELPQTGEEKSEAGIFGLAIAAVAGLLGIAADRKRN